MTLSARLSAVGAIGLVSVAALAGCSATSGGASGGTGAASPSGGASDATRGAWVRGSKMTITNNTGADLVYQVSGSESTALANGASTTFGDDWKSTSSTQASVNIKKDATAATWAYQLKVDNPSIGTPTFESCGWSVDDKTNPGVVLGALTLTQGDQTLYCNFDSGTEVKEGTSQSFTITKPVKGTDGAFTSEAVGTVTVTRNPDDDDNKNWAVAITSVS